MNHMNLNVYKMGAIARLTIKNPTALNNPILHAVPSKMTVHRTLTTFPELREVVHA